MTYTRLKTLQAEQPAELDIYVIDTGRGAQLTSAPSLYHGEAVDPYDVPTSAEVIVQIVCTSDLICEARSPESQLVNSRQEGNWVWTVTAQNPGIAVIGIVAATYENGGATFVHATPVWSIPLTVQDLATQSP